MNITERQIVAIDRALNKGITVPMGDKDYKFTALDLGDLATILQWRKDKHLKSYLAATNGKVDRSTRFGDLYDIQHRAAKIEDYSPQDPEGLAYMSWLSLKKHHTDITLEQVTELVSDGKLAELAADIMKIHSGVDSTANPTEATDETS